MKKHPFSSSAALKYIIAVPAVFMTLITLLQLPTLWRMVGGDLSAFGLAIIQGGLPVLPYVFYAAAIWSAGDTLRRTAPSEPIEHILISGLRRTGFFLIIGSLALLFRSSDWVWRVIYNNMTPQTGVANDYLLAIVTALTGFALTIIAWRIRQVMQHRQKLKTELDGFV